MRTLMLLAAAAMAAFAQADSNVVSITASRQLNVQPDQVTVGITVTTTADQNIDAALALLKGTNITAADLSNVGTLSGLGLTFSRQWVFTKVIPLANLTTLLGALKLGDNVSVFVSGASTSPAAAAAQQCPYPAMINDARAQAAKLASAAGVTAGQIVSIAQTSVPIPVAQWTVPNVRTSYFTAVFDPATAVLSSFLLGVPLPAVSVPTSCSLIVQFQLGQ